MRAAPREAAAAAVLAAAGALLLWAFFAADTLTRIAWIGGVALACAGLLGAAAATGWLVRPGLTHAGLVAVASLAAIVVWQGLSLLWSVLPDASWNYVNRGLAYAAFLVLGLFPGSMSPRAPRLVAQGLAALMGVLLVAALVGKMFAGIEPDYGRVARLRWPIGYWNGLALLAVLALVLGLWLAVERGRVERRVAGAVLCYGAMVVAALTLSRGGIAVGAVAVVLWLAVDERRLESLVAFAVAAIPAGVVTGVAFVLDGVTSDGRSASVRAHDGRIFGGVVLAGAVVVAGAAFALAPRVPSERARRAGARAAVVASALVLAGLVAGTVVGWRDFVNPSDAAVPTSAQRLTSASSNNRWHWWGEAWQNFRAHPLDGTGAASFSLAHKLLRRAPAPPVNEPHDLPLQALAETGVVGFALLAVFVGGVAVAIRERFRDVDRAPVAALAVCALAWGLQALVDIPYELLAVAAPLFVILGALIARPGRLVRGRDVVWAVGVAGIAACAVLSLTAPALAEKRLEEGQYAEAHKLNPVSVEPLLGEALEAELAGRLARAQKLYRDAVSTQPDNPEPWVQLGLFELQTKKDDCAAYQALNEAYTLDRHNTDVFYPHGPLDRARTAVNNGACG
jgi:hypothetical protein